MKFQGLIGDGETKEYKWGTGSEGKIKRGRKHRPMGDKLKRVDKTKEIKVENGPKGGRGRQEYRREG